MGKLGGDDVSRVLVAASQAASQVSAEKRKQQVERGTQRLGPLPEIPNLRTILTEAL